MFVVCCSWCNQEISRVPGKNEVSHGICLSCYRKLRDEMRALFRKTAMGRIEKKTQKSSQIIQQAKGIAT